FAGGLFARSTPSRSCSPRRGPRRGGVGDPRCRSPVTAHGGQRAAPPCAVGAVLRLLGGGPRRGRADGPFSGCGGSLLVVGQVVGTCCEHRYQSAEQDGEQLQLDPPEFETRNDCAMDCRCFQAQRVVRKANAWLRSAEIGSPAMLPGRGSDSTAGSLGLSPAVPPALHPRPNMM